MISCTLFKLSIIRPILMIYKFTSVLFEKK